MRIIDTAWGVTVNKAWNGLMPQVVYEIRHKISTEVSVRIESFTENQVTASIRGQLREEL